MTVRDDDGFKTRFAQYCLDLFDGMVHIRTTVNVKLRREPT